MSTLLERMKNIDWEQVTKDRYKEECNNPNNYSYWYPLIKDCGIKIAESKIIHFPIELWKEAREFIYDNVGSLDNYIAYIHENIKDLHLSKPYNIKNGTFSDKFNARNCFCYRDEIPTRFLQIEYMSYIMETGGNTELVIRDVIQTRNRDICSIYNGLPLRPEFRAFIDFDTKEIKYIVNYWDYDYCYPNMPTLQDKIIFDNRKEYLENSFNDLYDDVYKLLKTNIFNSNIKGQWSVDIMYEPDNKEFWLIDMALANRSAYYDQEKFKEKGKDCE